MTSPTPTRYGLGGDVSPAESAKAEREIRRMRSSLKSWLKYRRLNDAVAAGEVKTRLPREVAARVVGEYDLEGEQKLADKLHALLSEMFDASSLPDPDVSEDHNAAVKLAKIAIKGKVPSEAQGPSAQGIVWMWPVVVVVGGLLFTITTVVRARADVQKEKERIKCIESGACTDYGFWLKMGGGLLTAWIIWDKFGAREAVQRRFKK